MANASLQIGNGNWAIKEDNLLGYSKAGTRFLPIPITMTRATLGTRVNPSGLIEDVALLGDELVSCGNFECADPDAVWSRDTGITISGGSANFTSVAGQYLSQNILTTGKSYYLSFDVSDFTSGALTIFGGAANNISSSFIINSTGTYTGYFTAGGLDNRIYFGNVFTGSIDNISVKEATIDGLARVDYTDGTGSLLVEPQRTNLITYSEDTSQWTDSGITYSVNYIISPDGTLNGSKAIINDTITSSDTRPMTSVAVTSGTNYVFSVFGKADEFDMINLDFSNSAFSNVSVDYNLTNGTVTFVAGSPVSQGVEDYGNGWYRCYVVATAIATTTTALIIRLDDNPTGDGTKGLYLWGSQVEQGSYPTSYIKTQGSTVTRNQDQYSKTGISDKINSEEGVFFVEMAALSDDGTNRIITLSDGSYNNSIRIAYYINTNEIEIRLVVGGVIQVLSRVNIGNVLIFNKIALKYKANDFALWVNGTEIYSLSSGSTYASETLNRLAFDDTSPSYNFFGKVKQLQIFKTALSDSELATLTT